MRQSDGRIAVRRRLLRNRLVVGAYRMVAPALHRARLRSMRDHVFHGPNFYLPDFPGISVATIHDLSIFRYPQFHPPERVAFMQKEIPLTLRRANFLIADSEFIRREVIEFFRWPEDKVVAVPLAAAAVFGKRGADLTRPLLGRLGLTHDRYCLCVGTIEPRKNIDSLIRAYAALPVAMRNAYPLVVAGDPGWLSEAVHTELEAGRQQGWLHYLGYLPQDELPLLYAGARGFALPSWYEGFGLPLLEAMASGLPVLTSRDSALSELADDAAILVDPADQTEITSGLRRLLEDAPWRERAEARSLAIAAGYSWQVTASRTAHAYRQAIRQA